MRSSRNAVFRVPISLQANGVREEEAQEARSVTTIYRTVAIMSVSAPPWGVRGRRDGSGVAALPGRLSQMQRCRRDEFLGGCV